MQRICVVGASGSGKSTVSTRLATALGVTRIELDALFHRPGWVEAPVDQFRAQVAALTAGPEWVVDGNYSSKLGDMVWRRADTMVWLDLPRATVMRQVFTRTVVRAITRRQLWNGNREPLTGLLRWNPHRSIVRWSWTSYPKVRERYEKVVQDPTYAHLQVVRLRSRAEVQLWLAAVVG